MALKVHDNDELAKVNSALQKIEDGTYGVCEVCQQDIPYDRLVALPYTSFCIEHTAKDVPTDRPVEEQVMLPPVDNSFAGRDDKDDIHDYEDVFQVVAKYGTSETPSDFEGILKIMMNYMKTQKKLPLMTNGIHTISPKQMN